MKLKKFISAFLAAVVAATALFSCGITAAADAADVKFGVALSESDDGYYIIDLYGLTKTQYRTLINSTPGFYVMLNYSYDGYNFEEDAYLGVQTWEAASSMVSLQDFDGRCGVGAWYCVDGSFFDGQEHTSEIEFSSLYGDDRYDRSYGISWRLNKRNENVQKLYSEFKDAPYYMVFINGLPTTFSETLLEIDGISPVYSFKNPNGKAPVDRGADISSLKFGKIANKAYTGKAVTPDVTIKDGSKKLVDGTDYTIQYKNNKAIGTATAVITGKGKYSGTKEISFKIVPKKVKVTKKITGSKVKLSWKKSAGAEGYEVYASQNGGKFTRMSTVATTADTETLVKGVTYKFRVRPYARVKGVVVYGSWSNTIKIN